MDPFDSDEVMAYLATAILAACGIFVAVRGLRAAHGEVPAFADMAAACNLGRRSRWHGHPCFGRSPIAAPGPIWCAAIQWFV
jgi:hypothetical protein